MTTYYIFGYGSLMNPTSLARTLPGVRRTRPATLPGYRRICNAPVNGYAYLNIASDPTSAVSGVLIPIDTRELELLKTREPGYVCTDVTVAVGVEQGTVYTFIAPSVDYPGLQVPRSYLATCLAGVPKEAQTQWLQETSMPYGIYEDMEQPVYANAC